VGRGTRDESRSGLRKRDRVALEQSLAKDGSWPDSDLRSRRRTAASSPLLSSTVVSRATGTSRVLPQDADRRATGALRNADVSPTCVQQRGTPRRRLNAVLANAGLPARRLNAERIQPLLLSCHRRSAPCAPAAVTVRSCSLFSTGAVNSITYPSGSRK